MSEGKFTPKEILEEIQRLSKVANKPSWIPEHDSVDDCRGKSLLRSAKPMTFDDDKEGDQDYTNCADFQLIAAMRNAIDDLLGEISYWRKNYPEGHVDGEHIVTGYIYFLLGEKTRLLKIGYSSGPGGRVEEFFTGSADRLTMLGIIAGTKNREHALHRRFAHLNDHGEWFRYCPELAWFLRKIGFTSDAIDDECSKGRPEYVDPFANEREQMENESLTESENMDVIREVIETSGRKLIHDHLEDMAKGFEATREAAYRRGFHHGIGCIQELANTSSLKSLLKLIDIADSIAARMRFEERDSRHEAFTAEVLKRVQQRKGK